MMITSASTAVDNVRRVTAFDEVHPVTKPNHCADSAFERDVLTGLSRPRKSISCKWLYDYRGCDLFEQISRASEYYLTRSEIAILECCSAPIASAVGPGATLVELGSGSCRKAWPILAALQAPAAYVPIDISANYLIDSARALRAAFPKLAILPHSGDISDSSTLWKLWRSDGALTKLADTGTSAGRCLGFFSGSTLGNFEPDAAVALLKRFGQALGSDSMLAVGIDSTQDRSLLLPAYDDSLGVTAAFNRNLLARINRELGGNLDPMAFEHEVRFNAERGRIEMHLVCRSWETFEVRGRYFVFEPGESIHTENSYKYTPARFHSLARTAGWTVLQSWTDGASAFGVHLLERSRS